MILIGGGSRSGKSRAALRFLESSGPRSAFIATAQAFDDEMQDRIARHRAERDLRIVTFEEPHQVSRTITAHQQQFDSMIVDCLTLWLSNRMLAGSTDIESECRDLIDSASRATCQVILVTNEVGCGIVPENALARRFRDQAGRLNQIAAERADEVYWMIFGIPLRVK